MGVSRLGLDGPGQLDVSKGLALGSRSKDASGHDRHHGPDVQRRTHAQQEITQRWSDTVPRVSNRSYSWCGLARNSFRVCFRPSQVHDTNALASKRPKGQRAKGPKGQRAKGPKGQRAKGPKGQRAKGPEGQRARGPKGKRAGKRAKGKEQRENRQTANGKRQKAEAGDGVRGLCEGPLGAVGASSGGRSGGRPRTRPVRGAVWALSGALSEALSGALSAALLGWRFRVALCFRGDRKPWQLESYYRRDASCLSEALHVAGPRYLHSTPHPRHDPLEGQSSSVRERGNATDLPWR